MPWGENLRSKQGEKSRGGRQVIKEWQVTLVKQAGARWSKYEKAIGKMFEATYWSVVERDCSHGLKVPV